MIDAIWDYYQHNYPKHSKKWLADRKRRLVGYNLPRFWYVDNTNLERCGLKIKYENIFPKKVSIVPRHPKHPKGKGHNNGLSGGYNRQPYNNYDDDQDIDVDGQDMTYPQHEEDFDDTATENDNTDNESNNQNSEERSNDDDSE